ncbi:zinc-binding dehydrogenase, partial [Pseudonocardia sp. McavD-2-B]
AGRAGDLVGRTVLVNGAGPIGCLAVAAVRHRGAATVLAADLDPGSLAVARAMGADEVVDASAAPLPDEVDVVVEASGAPSALGPVLRACVRGGTVVQVGNLPGAPVPAVLGDLVTREITWVGSFRFVEIADALDALAGGVDVGPVVSHRFDLADAGEAMAVAAAPGSSKVMLRLDR